MKQLQYIRLNINQKSFEMILIILIE